MSQAVPKFPTKLVPGVPLKLPAMQELEGTQVQSWGQEDPLEEGMATHSLQFSCLQNPMDRGVWWATVHRVSKSQT